MSSPPRIELCTRLDRALLEEVLELIDTTAAIDGHRPVGEHKYAHLKVGATGWVGILAYDEARRLIGYAHTRWNPPDAHPRVAVEVVVHPHADRSVVARRLLEEAKGVLARAGGGSLWLWVHRVQDPADTLAARVGFAVQRELLFMVRDLSERPNPPAPPPGVTVRPYRPAVDDEALLEVNNAAFVDHPENGDWDRAELERRRGLDWFDPEGLLMAWRGGRAVGFHWTKWHGHDAEDPPAHEPVGEVYVLAVHPDCQGIGLGRFLLDVGLEHLHGRGCRQAVLYVDSASKEAVALYESEGFAQAYREVCYEVEVAPEWERDPSDLRRPAF